MSAACPQAGSQLTPPWSNSSLHYPDSQISSPAPSDSTAASSPTSPASPAQYRPFPRDSWQATGYTGYFPPPNTVAPHTDHAKLPDLRRPDACYGGGSHRYAGNPRHCPETAASGDVDTDSAFASRLYVGTSNKVAPGHPGHSGHPSLSGHPSHPGHPGHGIPEHFGGHTAIMAGFPHPGGQITGYLPLSFAIK